jgi:hypothetical protein
MGGEGSGRKPDVVKRLIEESKTPIAISKAEGIFLPNYSGIKDAVRKDKSETLNLVNGTLDEIDTPTILGDGVIFQYGSGTLYSDGWYWAFQVYAFKNTSTGRVYSSALSLNGEDIGAAQDMTITLTWNAVTGADGYKVVISNDDINGYYGTYYYETTNTYLYYGDGITEENLTLENPMVVTPLSPSLNATDSITTIGHIDTTGTISAHNFQGTNVFDESDFFQPVKIASERYVGDDSTKGQFSIENTSTSGIGRFKVIGKGGGYLTFRAENAATNEKALQFGCNSGSLFYIGLLNDLENAENLAFVIRRSGSTPTWTAIPHKLSVGIAYTTTATAKLHIGAGSATAATAPIKLNSGTNMTTPEAGAIEWDGTNLYITQTGGTRKTIAYV